MSAVMAARTVRQAEGLDPVRALQRVLYRSAKQDPERRFHALFDKVARSDVLWRAWADVAANRGAPGVDGVRVDDVADGAWSRCGRSSTGSASGSGRVPTGPRRCGGLTFRNRAGRARPGRSVSPPW